MSAYGPHVVGRYAAGNALGPVGKTPGAGHGGAYRRENIRQGLNKYPCSSRGFAVPAAPSPWALAALRFALALRRSAPRASEQSPHKAKQEQ